MGNNSKFDIDINALANNEKAIEVLLEDYARVHAILAEQNSSHKDNEGLMKQVLKSSENAILVTKNLDEIIEYNDQFVKLFGISSKTVKNSPDYQTALVNMYKTKCLEMLVENDVEEADFIENAYAITELAKDAPQILKMANGKRLRYKIRYVSDDILVHSYVDITKEFENYKELKLLNKKNSISKDETEEARSQLYNALEILDDGFVIYDKDDRLVTFNQAFKEQFGATGKHLRIGETYENLAKKIAYSGIAPNAKGREDEFVKDLIDQRMSDEGLEKTFQTHDGLWIRQRDKRTSSGELVGLRTNITELKEREEELAKTTKLFVETTNNMVQGIAVFTENKLQFFNDRILKLLNIPEGSLEIGNSFEEYMQVLQSAGHYENDDAAIRKNFKMLENGEIHQVERKTHYGVHLKIDVIPRSSGNTILTYTDITELMEREQEIKFAKLESEQNLSRQMKIAKAIPQGIILFENDGVVFFNDQVMEILEIDETILFEGQSFEEFLNMQADAGKFGPEIVPENFIEAHLDHAAQGVPYQRERRTVSGKTVRVDGIPNNENNYLTLSFTDISSLKEREQEIEIAKVAAENASTMLTTSTNVMLQGLLFFHDDSLEYFNPKFFELVGAPEDKVYKGMKAEEIMDLMKEFGDFSTGMTVEEYEAYMKENFTKHKSYSLERNMLNGKILQLDAVAADNGALVVTYTDITDAKLRERELEETTKIAASAERAKSEFLANMSHEIRTPMNGVMGMAELLASTELDSKQKMFTDVIVKSGASLLTIINDILDFSKIDAGQMELDPAPFNLREAIEDVATLVSSKVAEKDLELIVRVNPNLPNTMVGDVGRIRQIITNLLGNAVKFTEKGHVFVNVEGEIKKNDENQVAGLKFSIEDTGIGIPEEKCAHVFQKFSQVDTSATRKHEGTGLGLSISSSLVKLMGGEIGVESEVGMGSTFWFTADLPIHEDEKIKQVIPGDMTGARVLVIDDNEVNRSILAEQMAAWKFDGASTSTGEQGLEVMRNVAANGMSLDLVILDYQMPEMSGAEVLEVMRKDEALKDIPVVMLTSVDSSQTNQRLLQLGAEANLTKPTRSSMLLETILQVIANKRADVKTRSINNLTAKSTPYASNIQLPKDQPNHIVKKANDGLDILVAEDNEVNQIVFRQILEETDLNFQIVENGHLALATYKAQQPRLVLMDVSMPEMNGKEATMAIRKHERDNQMKRTPIVGVTAHALKGDMESCIDAGMDDYLSKPVSPNKLSLKIEQWLKVDLEKTNTG